MIHVLLITSKTDVTTDFIVQELTKRQIGFYRFNTEEIGHSVSINLDFGNNQFFIEDNFFKISINLKEIKSVYLRRPEINDHFENASTGETNFLRAELLYALEGIYAILQDAFWFNHIYNIRSAENKIYQLLLARQIGFTLPASLISNRPDKALFFYNEQKCKCIIKPIKSGLIEGLTEEGVIFTSRLILDSQKAERIQSCPVYIQQEIEKEADIRITVVGDNIFAAKIHSQHDENSSVDWRKSQIPLVHSRIELPESISQLCIDLTKRLHLNFGAIDMVLDKYGNYYFLEINPNGQWAWIEKRLRYPITQSITDILIEKGNK